MVKNFLKFIEFPIFLLCFLLSVILAIDKSYSTTVLDGIKLWFACVLPSLIPYFFITAILSSLKLTGSICTLFSPATKRLFNVNGIVSYAYFMSVISGYPVGAKMVCDLKEGGFISQTESVRASALCSTSSPMFLIASVGSIMFNNTLFGLLLFCSNVICSLIVGITFSFYKRKDKPTNSVVFSPQKTQNFLYDTAYSSVISVLVVGCLITIFYLLTDILFNLNLLNGIISLFGLILGNEKLATGLCLGLFECTKGLKVISTTSFGLLTLPVCAFVCGFGGLSVIAQSVAYLKKAKIKTAPFVLSKLLSAVLNFIVCLVFSLVFF